MRTSCWCCSWLGFPYQRYPTERSPWPHNASRSVELFWTLGRWSRRLTRMDAGRQRLMQLWSVSNPLTYSCKLMSNPLRPLAGRSRPGKHYCGNHHQGLSNRRLTRLMVISVWAPCKLELQSPSRILLSPKKKTISQRASLSYPLWNIQKKIMKRQVNNIKSIWRYIQDICCISPVRKRHLLWNSNRDSMTINEVKSEMQGREVK